MKRNSRFLAVLLLMILAALGNFTLAQSSQVYVAGELVYWKFDVESNYITRFGHERVAYNLPLDECSLRSPDGRYSLHSTLEPITLEIWRLKENLPVITVPWDVTWKPCGWGWINNAQFAIRLLDTTEILYFDISGENLTEINPVFMRPAFPPLRGGSSKLYYNPAPDGDHVLFQQCFGTVGFHDLTGEPSCDLVAPLVIYSLRSQRVLHTVTETAVLELQRYDDAQWSPDGRYLTLDQIFPPPGITVSHYALLGFPLEVYDTLNEGFLNTDTGYIDRDQSIPYLWSPNSKKVAFWTVGRWGHEDPIDLVFRNLVIYDTKTEAYWQTLVYTKAPLQLTWSPDSEALIYITPDHLLMHYDVVTEEVSILDMHVREIIAWRSSVETNTDDIVENS